MAEISAGILPYRVGADGCEVFLVHPGGPFWAKKDEGAWSLAKGRVEPDEDLFAAAQREFREETGLDPTEPFRELGEVTQGSGKRVFAWASEMEINPASVRGNTFPLEWPPRSGHRQEFPEVDRGEWFGIEQAREKILPAQRPFLDRLTLQMSDSEADS